MESWPHSLSATSTHDSKRGEDFRARLHVLSEASAEWIEAFRRWRELNRPLVRELDGDAVPDANEEYLLYQTLVGTWPLTPMDARQLEQYRDRILQYMEKSLREAKIHTSWMNPSDAYDAAVRDFIGDLLDEKGKAFAADVGRFVAKIADSGFVNSLAQLVLKMTLPGVPDFYQGTELWDFNLVDPDNRRPVDFETRRRSLDRLEANVESPTFASDLAARWPDSDIKLWITSRGLALRRELPEAFNFGEYIPLSATGTAADHVVAFARRWEQHWVLSVVPRHYYRLTSGKPATATYGLPHADWVDTRVVLPDDAPTNWHSVLSGDLLDATDAGSQTAIGLAEMFRAFPVALLTSTSS
jgi:(1->4)-alpha-D-glucan 1-alpha-D-glucosylmutase